MSFPFPRARENSSSFRGVCKEKKTDKWRAEIQINGKKESLGYHPEEEKAVRTYDRALIVLKGERAKTNYPVSEYADEMEQLNKWNFEEFQATLNTKSRRHATWTSSYRGVRKHEHKQKAGTVSVKWRAEITVAGKKTSLGYHDTEEKAARAYDAASREHPGFSDAWLNFPDDVLQLPGPECGAVAEEGAIGVALSVPQGTEWGDAATATAGGLAVGSALLLPAPGVLTVTAAEIAAGDLGGDDGTEDEVGEAETSAEAAAGAAAAGAAGIKSVGGVKERKVAAAVAAAKDEVVASNPEGGYLASLAD